MVNNGKYIDMEASKNGGAPKMMVYFMENPMEEDDWGEASFQETIIY